MPSTNPPAEAETTVSRQVALEALPVEPSDQLEEQKASKISCFVAWIMDEAITIPGTKIKIGIDPILGLLPAGGDIAASTAGVFALIEAIRRGLPVRAMWKIVGNIFMNAGFGTIPIIGDIFSVVFRSNSRNRDIINENLRLAVDEGREPSWWRVVPIIAMIVLLTGGAIMLNLYIWYLITNFVLEKIPLPEGFSV